MTTTFILIWIFAFMLGGTALGALMWAIRTGQFQQINQGASSIFDADEPEGEFTDQYPGRGTGGSKNLKSTESAKRG